MRRRSLQIQTEFRRISGRAGTFSCTVPDAARLRAVIQRSIELIMGVNK